MHFFEKKFLKSFAGLKNCYTFAHVKRQQQRLTTKQTVS